MKKITLGITILSFAALVIFVSSTGIFANDRHDNKGHQDDHNRNGGIFNPDRELSKSNCANLTGNPIVNVTQKVKNDADSGEAGNYWAFDYFTRTIKVWKTTTGVDTYCAIVTFDGNFSAVPGQVGPGNSPVNERIDSPVNGDFSGGYRATFNGTFAPVWSTTGNVGTTDYHCNIVDDCPGYIDWVGQYFPGYSNFDQPWWGWKYTAGSHGTWINAVSGNSGNIL